MVDLQPAAGASTDTPSPLADLARAAAAGDRSAFGALHQALAPAVHAVLVARLPAAEVDDVLQEVMLAAWRALPSLRDAEAVGPWVLTIARRASARFHGRRHAPAEDLPEELVDPKARSGSGAEILAQLRELPAAYRETLAMRLVEGWSSRRIADATGLTEPSVRVNLSRGLGLLRERLTRMGWP
jgi:RNA polymerase sigma-70 factor (ECF subfamily)